MISGISKNYVSSVFKVQTISAIEKEQISDSVEQELNSKISITLENLKDVKLKSDENKNYMN